MERQKEKLAKRAERKLTKEPGIPDVVDEFGNPIELDEFGRPIELDEFGNPVEPVGAGELGEASDSPVAEDPDGVKPPVAGKSPVAGSTPAAVTSPVPAGTVDTEKSLHTVPPERE